MSNFETAVEMVLKLEGGLSDRPLSEDPGGLTNYGISTRLLKDIGYPKTADKLTVDDAKKIYYNIFWKPLARLPWPVVLGVFDHSVNAGQRCAVRLLQRTLNEWFGHDLEEDGLLGVRTTTAAEGEDGEALFEHYLWERIRWYATGPNLQLRRANLSGWVNRVYRLRSMYYEL